MKETKRRSIVKSLIWRLIGIVWTWVGAYVIILLLPPSRRSAALIASLIVVYHHSTRMIMYYLYERIWAAIGWGRGDPPRPMTLRAKIWWPVGIILTLVFIFFLIMYVTPKVKSGADTGDNPRGTRHKRTR